MSIINRYNRYNKYDQNTITINKIQNKLDDKTQTANTKMDGSEIYPPAPVFVSETYKQSLLRFAVPSLVVLVVISLLIWILC